MREQPAYLCIDADAHLTEARDTWTSRVAAKFKDQVPVVRWDPEAKQECWYMGGIKLPPVGMTACAGYAKPFPEFPATYEEAIDAAYDVDARLRYMDETGIWAQVIYPNIGGFGGQDFLKLDDPELKLACVRAYNDFLVDWASADPARFVLNVAVPFWDLDETVKEVERCLKLGFRGVNFTAAPQAFGLPSLGDLHWEPLWSLAEEARLPISFHIGSGDMFAADFVERSKVDGMPATIARASVDCYLTNGIQLTDLLFSGVLCRHPDLRFVSVESGIGWIPFVLEAADYQFHVNGVGRTRPEFRMLPSDYFRQNVYACYWFERGAAEQALDAIGRNNIMFETDFPHPTCLYGDVAETIEAGLSGMPADVRRKILFENAAELFRIDLPESIHLAG